MVDMIKLLIEGTKLVESLHCGGIGVLLVVLLILSNQECIFVPSDPS